MSYMIAPLGRSQSQSMYLHLQPMHTSTPMSTPVRQAAAPRPGGVPSSTTAGPAHQVTAPRLSGMASSGVGRHAGRGTRGGAVTGTGGSKRGNHNNNNRTLTSAGPSSKKHKRSGGVPMSTHIRTASVSNRHRAPRSNGGTTGSRATAMSDDVSGTAATASKQTSGQSSGPSSGRGGAAGRRTLYTPRTMLGDGTSGRTTPVEDDHL